MMATYAVLVPKNPVAIADFAARLVELRKEKGLTQLHLAERVGVHAQQLKRYEAGISQPTFDVIRNMAMALVACPIFCTRLHVSVAQISLSSDNRHMGCGEAG